MFTAYFFVLGLAAGSFANAAIWRIKTGRSFIKGRSMCPHCKHQLRNVDLIPVLSWIILRGRCRDCKKPISIQYPAVELLTAVLFGLSYFILKPHSTIGWIDFAFWLYIVTSLVILAVYDLKWMLLPDVILIPAIVVATVHLPVVLAFGLPFSAVRGPLIAAAVAGGGFYALAALSKGKWMGGGDIKLVFLMGLVLGIQKGIVAMFFATMFASIIGGALLLSRRLKGRYIAFGPFLAGATVFAMLYGHHIVHWYLHISSLEYLTF